MADGLKPYPIEHFNINPPQITFEDTIFKMQQKIYAECVDRQDTAIVEAVIRLAREAGVTEMFLLDKQFVMNALKEALARRINDGRFDKP